MVMSLLALAAVTAAVFAAATAFLAVWPQLGVRSGVASAKLLDAQPQQ
jgi:hypothetical protein